MPRIFGGSEAAPHSSPWQVAIVGELSRKIFCGGALISDRHVLTSSIFTQPDQQLFIDNEDFEVLVGIHNLNSVEGANRHRILKSSVHPDYARKNIRIPIRDSGDNINYVVYPQFSFDFTIFHLLKPVEIGPKIAPVCLPSPTLNDEFLNGKNLEVSGWGWKNQFRPSVDTLDNYLYSAIVVGIKNEQCRNEITNFIQLSNINIDFGVISESMLCSAHPYRGTCPFFGDSGGNFTVKFRFTV